MEKTQLFIKQNGEILLTKYSSNEKLIKDIRLFILNFNKNDFYLAEKMFSAYITKSTINISVNRFKRRERIVKLSLKKICKNTSSSVSDLQTNLFYYCLN